MADDQVSEHDGAADVLGIVGDLSMANEFGKAPASHDPNAIAEFESSMGRPCAGPIGTDSAGNLYTRDNQGQIHVTPAASRRTDGEPGR